jgi:hypothetical protein
MRYIKLVDPKDAPPATRCRGFVRDPAIRGWSWWWDGDEGTISERDFEDWPGELELHHAAGPVSGLLEFDAVEAIPFEIVTLFYRKETPGEARSREVSQPAPVADQANAELEQADLVDLEARCRRVGFDKTADIIAAERAKREDQNIVILGALRGGVSYEKPKPVNWEFREARRQATRWLQESGPSAVASAPAARDRASVYCQSQYDPDD